VFLTTFLYDIENAGDVTNQSPLLLYTPLGGPKIFCPVRGWGGAGSARANLIGKPWGA
jgi:hypothetical protein